MAIAKKAKKRKSGDGVKKPRLAKKKAFEEDSVKDRSPEDDEDPEPRPWEGKTKF